MTRKFRLSLLVSVAGAVGLHVRPCWTCCTGPDLDLSGAEAPVEVVALTTAGRSRPALLKMWGAQLAVSHYASGPSG